MKNSIKSKLLTMAMALFSLCAFADPATGWKQTAAGMYDYNDPANWVNDDINGVFGEDLVLTGNQTIRFENGLTIPGLQVKCDGGGYSLSFTSAGTSGSVLTTSGDIVFDGSNISKVTMGNSNSALNFTFNLGGAVRTIQTSSAIELRAILTNGGVEWRNSANVTLVNANTYTMGTWLHGPSAVLIGRGDVFGDSSSDLHFCEGARLLTSSKTLQTIAGNKIFIDGDCSFGSDSGNYVSINLGSGAVSIAKPLTMTCTRHTFTFGALAEDSPCTWSDVTVQKASANYPATLLFGSFTVPAGETCVLQNANYQLDCDDLEGTLEIVGGSLTLSEAYATPKATVLLGDNSTLKLVATGGGVVHLVDKVVWPSGGGKISVAGAAGKNTTYEIDLELKHGHGTQTLESTPVSDGLTTLHITSLDRAEGAMLNVGSAVDGETVRLTIDGQSAADVLPWVRMAYGEIVKYDTTKGVVAVDQEGSDYVVYQDGMMSADLANKHVRIPDGLTFTPDADVSVKSLTVVSSTESTYIGDTDYTITVLSGAVNLYASRNIGIRSALNFNGQHGYVTFRHGYIQYLFKSLANATGMTFSSLLAAATHAKDNKGLNLSGATTYSGNTYIHGVVYAAADGCFPYGPTRAGDVYNYDYMNFWKSSTDIHVNGLNGVGWFEKDSGTMVLHLGADGSDGEYNATTYSGARNMGIQKHGSGKQILTGSPSFKLNCGVDGGELEIDGGLAVSDGKYIYADKVANAEQGGTLSGAGLLTANSGVQIRSGGTLKPGSALNPDTALRTAEGTPVQFSVGAALVVHLGADYCSQLLCGGVISGAVEVPVTIDLQLKKSGKWKLLEASSIEPTFTKASGIGRLVRIAAADSESGKEELWLESMSGFSIIIR